MKHRAATRTLLQSILLRRWVPFACPLCERPIEVHRRDLGADLRCPHCTAWIAAPDPRIGRPATVRDPRVLEALRFQKAHGRSPAQLRRRGTDRPASDTTQSSLPSPLTRLPTAPALAPEPRSAPTPAARPRPEPAAHFRPAQSDEPFMRGPDAPPEWDCDMGTVHRVPAGGLHLTKATRAAWAVASALVIVAIGMFIFRDLEGKAARARDERVRQEQAAAGQAKREEARLAQERRAAAPVEVAREALRASGWRESLPLIRHAARVGPIMETWYEKRPWSPVELSEIGGGRFAQLQGRNFYVFEARDAAGKRHALGLEETAAGWKLDWEVFAHVAYHDWSRWLETRPAQPRHVRAGVIRRTPSQAMLESAGVAEERAFGVMLYGPDISQGAIYAVLDRESPVAVALAGLVSFDRGRKFILEAAFPPAAQSRCPELVAIHRIVEEGWTYMDETPAPAPRFTLAAPSGSAAEK